MNTTTPDPPDPRGRPKLRAYADLDEAARAVRDAVVSRHIFETLGQLRVVPFQTIVKVTVPPSVARSPYAVREWWLYPVDPARTLWQHPESADADDKGETLGASLWAIAAVYAYDLAGVELASLPGQVPDQ